MIKSVTRGRPTEICCPEKPSSGVATPAPAARAPRGQGKGHVEGKGANLSQFEVAEDEVLCPEAFYFHLL